MYASRHSDAAHAAMLRDDPWLATVPPSMTSTAMVLEYNVAEPVFKADIALSCFTEDLLNYSARVVDDIYDKTNTTRREHSCHTRVRPALKNKAVKTAYCTSCKRHRHAVKHFTPGRKTCKPCLKRHNTNTKRARAHGRLTTGALDSFCSLESASGAFTSA